MIRIFEPNLNGNTRLYLNQCLDENWISSQGRFVAQFEKHMARNTLGNAVSTSNGTVALHLALLALGVKKNDEVIVPNITFGARLNAILYIGAIPVIVDVDEQTWNINLEKVKAVLNDRTKAIITVCLFGNPSGIEAVTKLAKEKKIYCIVDAAQAVGAKIFNRDIGNWGDAVTYSYFGNKVITTGEGGGIIFNSSKIADKARVLRDHGMAPGRRYHHEVVGYNYRMTNLQAAVGVAQYEIIDILLAKRLITLQFYQSELQHHDISFQHIEPDCFSSNWVVAIRVTPHIRERIEKNFAASSIEYRRCFEPMNIQPAFEACRKQNNYDLSACLYKELLLLPAHPNLSESDLKKVTRNIKQSMKIE